MGTAVSVVEWLRLYRDHEQLVELVKRTTEGLRGIQCTSLGL